MEANLLSLSVDQLQVGTELSDHIYCSRGRLLLLKSGSVLTEKFIRKLQKTKGWDGYVKVTSSFYDSLLQTKMVGFSQNQLDLEVMVGYQDIRHRTDSFIKVVELLDRTPKLQVDDIAGQIMECVRIVNPSALFQCINGCSSVDEYLRRHSSNVALLNGLIGKWMGLPRDNVYDLVVSGLVHDIGKLKVPQHLLNFLGQLSDDDFKEIQKHTQYSSDLLTNGDRFDDKILDAARFHHEKLNTSGYPAAIGGDEIPLYARVTAISDIYDALVSKRAYKDSNNPFVALNVLHSEQYRGLEPFIVMIFLGHVCGLLTGQSVLMTDNSIGVIRYIDMTNIEFPIVEINGNIIRTNKDLYCTLMLCDKCLLQA